MRPDEYTPAEDAILQLGRNVKETNFLLKAAGFAGRTRGQIDGRRNTLKQKEEAPSLGSLIEMEYALQKAALDMHERVEAAKQEMLSES